MTWLAGFQKVLAVGMGPVLAVHDSFYGKLNAVLTGVLDANASIVPGWMTADAVTWARSALLPLTLLLLVSGHGLLPALLVLLVDFGDFFDGVVWRWWNARKLKGLPAPGAVVLPVGTTALAGAPDSPLSFDTAYASRVAETRAASWGQYFDAVADKAFLVPVWITMAALPAGAGSWLSLLSLWALASIESYSALIRTRRYYSAPTESPPVPIADAANDSGVKSDEVGKAKQTLQMVGTACLLLPLGLWYLGLALLALSIPLAVESVRRKIAPRSLFVPLEVSDSLDAHALRYLSKAANLGSHLTVGVIAHDPVALKDAMALVALLRDVDAVFPLLKGEIACSSAWLAANGFHTMILPGPDAPVSALAENEYDSDAPIHVLAS